MSKKNEHASKEEDFLNSARGETSLQKNYRPKIPAKSKRKQIAFYLNDEEMAILKEAAYKINMNVSQYLRFKVFSGDKS
ncbi:hypothetical protein DMB95_09365 [Campylobacter sp. MIT 12-8780]|nr:hypothetical protein [Campylobacter sp. MIT 19-121]TKX28292.1 hypothetical protein CQA38_08465 [Campylobacter sp. MIT 12-5580]TQR39997.1 hypothetical protein DMB95_09365 [Campylobacter sp. MIT 12-8780]